MPISPLSFLSTMSTLSPFLAQTSVLTLLYDPRPFALVFFLTLSSQILFSISKISWVLIPLVLLCPHLSLFSLPPFLLPPAFSFHIWMDTMLFLPSFSPSLSLGCRLLAMAFLVSPLFSLDYTCLSLLFPHVL